jgi:hypothetical protein
MGRFDDFSPVQNLPWLCAIVWGTGKLTTTMPAVAKIKTFFSTSRQLHVGS